MTLNKVVLVVDEEIPSPPDNVDRFWVLRKKSEKSCINVMIYYYYKIDGLETLEQGCSNLSLEVHSAAEFSSNPDQTHLPVIF